MEREAAQKWIEKKAPRIVGMKTMTVSFNPIRDMREK